MATVGWTGREELNYLANGLSLTMDCYYERAHGAYTVTLLDRGIEDGCLRTLTAAEVAAVETSVRAYLAPRRFFGLPIGRRAVHIVKGQTLAS